MIYRSKINSFNLESIRVTLLVLVIFFILSISTFLSSKSFSKRFNSAILNEEIDGTTNTAYKNQISRIFYELNASKIKLDTSEVQPQILRTNAILSDLLITIKTTKSNHRTRLKPILDTWFNLVSTKTYFITDGEDQAYSIKTGNKMVVTNCEKSHQRCISRIFYLYL
jgi:hypothetical protein